MVGMGYNLEEIQDSLAKMKYDEITATYLLLGRKASEVDTAPGHCSDGGVFPADTHSHTSLLSPAGAQWVGLQQQPLAGQTQTQQRAQRPVPLPPQSPEERLLQPQAAALQRARWRGRHWASSVYLLFFFSSFFWLGLRGIKLWHGSHSCSGHVPFPLRVYKRLLCGTVAHCRRGSKPLSQAGHMSASSKPLPYLHSTEPSAQRWYFVTASGCITSSQSVLQLWHFTAGLGHSELEQQQMNEPLRRKKKHWICRKHELYCIL